MPLTPNPLRRSTTCLSLIVALGVSALSACNTGDVGIVGVVVKGAGTGAGNVTAVGNVQSGTDDIDINCDFPGHSCEDAIEVPGDESAGGYLNLIATPSAGSHFTSWTGCSSITGSVCKLSFPPRQTWTVTAQFDLGAAPPPEGILGLVSGNQQSAPAGSVLPQLLVVEWVDVHGNAGPATVLTWQVTGGGTIAQATTATDGTNDQFENTWTLGAAGTPQTVTVSEPGGSSVVFTATATALGPYLLSIASGDGQSALGGTQLHDPLVVLWGDGNGHAGPVTTLTWQPSTGGTMAQATTATDGRTHLNLNFWTLGAAGTPQTVTVTEPGGGSVTFTATATPGGLIPRPESRPATAPRAPR